MKEGPINCERAVVAHHQAAEVAEPGEGAFHLPPSPIATQCPPNLRRRLASVLAMRSDQFDVALGEFPTQRVAIVAATSLTSAGKA